MARRSRSTFLIAPLLAVLGVWWVVEAWPAAAAAPGDKVALPRRQAVDAMPEAAEPVLRVETSSGGAELSGGESFAAVAPADDAPTNAQLGRFQDVYRSAIERLRRAFPEQVFAEEREPDPRTATEFVAAYERIVGEDLAAWEAYQSELVDQITVESTARWERRLPPGQDPLAVRDSVLAGTHDTIEMPPGGGHLVMMSNSYMIVPKGHSPALDWHWLASQAATKEADMRLLVLVGGLR